MANGDNKAFDAMNAITEAEEVDLTEDGEVSAWFPEGKFLGMNIPSGTSRIVDILVSAAIGGTAGLGRTSVSKAEQASRMLSPQLQKSVVGKAVREVGKHNKDKMRFIQEEIKGIQKSRLQIINDNMKRITSSSEKAGYRKHLKELESEWALSDFKSALSDWNKSGVGIKLVASRVGRFNPELAKLTPEAERFYIGAARSLGVNVPGATAGAVIGSQRKRIEQY
jgi:hypothetical protein